jgi:tRNA pseudouridine55 synthase
MASGVLPICLGEATKFSQYLLDSDKAYRATIRFGEKTNTADAEGDIVEKKNASAITADAVRSVLPNLTGHVRQVPPMFSALKRDGQPLYKLARQGIEVERKARDICIHTLQLESFRAGDCVEADISVVCSKGTYVRTLAEDIAAALGNLGHLTALQRTQSGVFELASCMDLSILEEYRSIDDESAMDALLLPSDIAVNHFPMVEVSLETGYYVRRGQSVFIANSPVNGLVRIKEEGGIFLGVGEVLDDGRIQPRRLIADNSSQQD